MRAAVLEPPELRCVQREMRIIVFIVAGVVMLMLVLARAWGNATETGAEAPMPGDFLKVESKAWSRWLEESMQVSWRKVPLREVLAGDFGPAALAVDEMEKLATPITFDAEKLSRREALWQMSRRYGFGVRWAQEGEPKTFLGLLETETQRTPVGGIVITTMTQVMRSDSDTYERLKKAGKITKEEVLDGSIYFAIEIGRDVRFDHTSAWVRVVERYKTAKSSR